MIYGRDSRGRFITKEIALAQRMRVPVLLPSNYNKQFFKIASIVAQKQGVSRAELLNDPSFIARYQKAFGKPTSQWDSRSKSVRSIGKGK